MKIERGFQNVEWFDLWEEEESTIMGLCCLERTLLHRNPNTFEWETQQNPDEPSPWSSLRIVRRLTLLRCQGKTRLKEWIICLSFESNKQHFAKDQSQYTYTTYIFTAKVKVSIPLWRKRLLFRIFFTREGDIFGTIARPFPWFEFG